MIELFKQFIFASDKRLQNLTSEIELTEQKTEQIVRNKVKEALRNNPFIHNIQIDGEKYVEVRSDRNYSVYIHLNTGQCFIDEQNQRFWHYYRDDFAIYLNEKELALFKKAKDTHYKIDHASDTLKKHYKYQQWLIQITKKEIWFKKFFDKTRKIIKNIWEKIQEL